jgi:hypothetical protein
VLPVGQKMVPAALVSCIDPVLLETLVCLEEIEGCYDVDKVTDANLEAWMKKSLGEVAKLTTTDDIASMVLQPKLAIKHLLSVVKPAQLKEVFEKDLLLDQIELRKDFYGFVLCLRKTTADADCWAATNRTGKDTKSSDRMSAGGSSRSHSSGSHSGSRSAIANDSASSSSKSKASKYLNDKTCNKNGKTDYHYMTDCPHKSKEAAVEMLAKHRAARAERPKEAFKKVEPAKKVGRVLFKAKNTSLAKMARVEGKLDGKTIIGVLDTGATSSAVTRSFVTIWDT